MADMADFMKDIEAKDKDVTKRTKLKGVSAKVQKAKASVPLPPIRNQVDIKNLKDKKKNEIFSD